MVAVRTGVILIDTSDRLIRISDSLSGQTVQGFDSTSGKPDKPSPDQIFKTEKEKFDATSKMIDRELEKMKSLAELGRLQREHEMALGTQAWAQQHREWERAQADAAEEKAAQEEAVSSQARVFGNEHLVAGVLPY